MTVSIRLPAWAKVREGSFSLTPFPVSSSSSFRPSVPRRSGSRESLWRCELTTPPRDRATVIEMEAWFARMAHRQWTFLAHDEFRRFPLGVGGGAVESGGTEILFEDDGGNADSLCTDFALTEGSGTGLVAEAAARGATTLLVKGLPAALAGQAALRAGDHFSTGLPGEENLHIAVADAVIDAAGKCRVEFVAPLWKRALPGDTVRFVRPTARFVMVDEQSGQIVRSVGQYAEGRIVGIEYPFQEPNA